MSEDTRNWMHCDGKGQVGRPHPALPTRRDVVVGTLTAALAAWSGRSALAQIVVGEPERAGQERDILITLFLRGGADGLSLVVPHGDDDYYRARPTIGLAQPRKESSGVVDLDGFFGFHPALAALQPWYADGHLGIVHAAGSHDQTRSHFEAMATVERGLPDDRATAASGWVARYLTATPPLSPSPLRAVAWGSLLPDSLRGATDVSVLASLNDFRLHKFRTPHSERDLTAALGALYRKGTNDAVRQAGRETLAVLDALKRVDPAHYRPANGATYPKSDLGDGLRQIACLIKAGIGLETACLDRGGWDTHVAQGGATGYLALQAKDLGNSLAAFAKDLGTDHLSRVTLVALTEFGRRVGENSGLGTDHGRGSVMFVLGGGVKGGKVYADWPGLAPDHLEPPGDLRVTTDYRHVLSEIVTRRLRFTGSLNDLFPGLPPQPGSAAASEMIRART